jgi:ribosome-binding factor A
MKTFRLARVAEVIREAAAKAILFELKDPRVKNVTVTRVEVSADLQHAKIYVSVMGSEKEQKLTMHGLKSATGFIQSRVAQQLTTRYVPRINFILDQGVKRSIAVSQLLQAERQRRGEEEPPAPNDEEAVTPPDLEARGELDEQEAERDPTDRRPPSPAP